MIFIAVKIIRLNRGFLLEQIEPLIQIIHPDVDDQAYRHGYVFLNGFIGAGQDPAHQRLGYPVPYDVAADDVDDILDYQLPVPGLVLKGPVLVQKITGSAAGDMVAGGGDPVTDVEHVVQKEHESGAHSGIDTPHDGVLPESNVKKGAEELFYQLFQGRDHLFSSFLKLQCHHSETGTA